MVPLDKICFELTCRCTVRCCPVLFQTRFGTESKCGNWLFFGLKIVKFHKRNFFRLLDIP